MRLKAEILVPRLGDFLVQRKLITESNLQEALEFQRAFEQVGSNRSLIGQTLISLGFIDRDTLDGVVTEQVMELHQALVDTNKNLEKMVEERTAELALAFDKISELSKLQIRFVSNICHESRTPLYHIMGNLELLVDEDMGPLNDDQQKSLKVINRAAERLHVLIEDLILFTATKEAPLKLRMEVVSVQSICEVAVTQIREAAIKAQIDLQIDCQARNAQVRGNFDRLLWVIRHLLDNAVKFTPPNGSVIIRTREENDTVIFTVEDTGIGISAEFHDEIFAPFRQLDEAMNRRYGGMGLGLTLVRKIIEAHGAVISVSSDLVRGSSFSFSLQKASS